MAKYNTAFASNTVKEPVIQQNGGDKQVVTTQQAKETNVVVASNDMMESAVVENEIHKSVDAYFDQRQEAMERQRQQRVASAQAKPVTATEAQKVAVQEADLPIRVLNQADIVGVNSGYYVIANVYSNKKYMNAFMADLEKKGLKAGQFYNKENGLYYVYLADYNFKEDAKTAYISNMNGKYQDEKWIMQVDDQSAIVLNSYVD
ncbi:SPOR domain-containing protein [Cytophaga sp. FL35]|nr:SPOR domain-containing protein [Cytophaga sp. FL35]